MPSAKVTPARRIGANTSFLAGDPRRHHPFHWRIDFDLNQWQVARHFVTEQGADLLEELAKGLRRDVLAAEASGLLEQNAGNSVSVVPNRCAIPDESCAQGLAFFDGGG